MLTIGQLAKKVKINLETIRYYQRIGLMRTPNKNGNYRYYNQADIDILNFIIKGKNAGLQLTEIKELLQLQFNDHAKAREVIAHRLAQIDQRISELTILKQRLNSWINQCELAQEKPCPILLALQDKT